MKLIALFCDNPMRKFTLEHISNGDTYLPIKDAELQLDALQEQGFVLSSRVVSPPHPFGRTKLYFLNPKVSVAKVILQRPVKKSKRTKVSTTHS